MQGIQPRSAPMSAVGRPILAILGGGGMNEKQGKAQQERERERELRQTTQLGVVDYY